MRQYKCKRRIAEPMSWEAAWRSADRMAVLRRAYSAFFQERTPLNLVRMGIAWLQQQFIMVRGKSSGGRRGGKGRRKYDVITTEMRIRLIRLVLVDGLTVAAACRNIGIKLTTGCLILRNYRKQKRIFQKPGSLGPDILPTFPVPAPKTKRKRSRAERLQARNALRQGETGKTGREEGLVREIKVQTEQGSEILQSQPVAAVLDSSVIPLSLLEPTFQWVMYPFPMYFWTDQSF